jgi:hypothetical protein
VNLHGAGKGTLMCMAKIRGGQRCYGHAKQAFNKALTQHYILSQSDPNSAKAQAVKAKVEVAGVQMASTPEGAHHLRTLAAVNSNLDRPEQAGWFDSMVRRGEVLRESNAAVKKAYADHPEVQRNIAHEANLRAIGSSMAQAGGYGRDI